MGLIAATRKSKKRWAKIHFLTHSSLDVAWIGVYLLVASLFWISSSDLVLVIVNFALNGYFDWILYSVWKQKEAARPNLPPIQFMSLGSSPHQSSKYRAPKQLPVLDEENAAKAAHSFDRLEHRGVFE